MNHVLTILKEKGCTVAQFAALAGVDRSTLYKQIKQGHKLQLYTILIYAQALSRITKKDWKLHQKKIADEVGVWIP